MLISLPDIPLQEEIRYFPSKAQGGNTRKLFADHSVHILLHTQQKQLSESKKAKLIWVMFPGDVPITISVTVATVLSKTERFFEKDDKFIRLHSWLAFI